MAAETRCALLLAKQHSSPHQSPPKQCGRQEEWYDYVDAENADMQADIGDWLAQHRRADNIYRMCQGQEGRYLLECYGQLVYGKDCA